MIIRFLTCTQEIWSHKWWLKHLCEVSDNVGPADTVWQKTHYLTAWLKSKAWSETSSLSPHGLSPVGSEAIHRKMCVVFRGGGNQRISSELRHGLVAVRGRARHSGEQGDCNECVNHRADVLGGDIQQPRLPDVNSSTVTELLSNSNYEIKKGKVPASRRQSLYFRVFFFREATFSKAVQYFPSL